MTNVCFGAGHKVLMGDFSWKPIENMVVGDEILAFDEHGITRGDNPRRWRLATVTATHKREAECLKLRTERGVLVVTPEHKFLSSCAARTGSYRWMHAKNVRIKGKVRTYLCFTFGPDEVPQETDYKAGWLACLFDGEGSVGSGGAKNDNVHLQFAQVQNAVLDQGTKWLSEKGFTPKVYWSKRELPWHDCAIVRIGGGVFEQFRFLAATRPVRMLENMHEVLAKHPPIFRSRRTVRVLEKSNIGMQTVYDISTTTGTFIVDGFPVHNCNKKPPHDEWKLHARGDVEAGLAALHALCRREEPALIVAFGEQALHALIAGDPDAALYKITEARGYVFPSEFGPVLACTHPAFILRNWHPWWALFCLDLQKAARICKEVRGGVGWASGVSAQREHFGEFVLLEETAPIAWPVKQTDEPIAIDIETGSQLEIECIGWAAKPYLGYCAPYREGFFRFFRELLASPNPKVFQNGQFDTTVLERHGFEVRNWQHDTMLLHHSLDPMLAGKVTLGDNDNGSKQTHKSLRFLASVYTDEPWWKEYAFTDEMQRYTLCAKDARVTLECFEKMQERLGARETNASLHQTRP